MDQITCTYLRCTTTIGYYGNQGHTEKVSK